MNFTPVTEDQIPKKRGRAGGVSTKLLSDFLASGIELAAVTLDSTDKKMESVRATVGNYVRRHELPIHVFSAGGGLYLKRDESMPEHYRQLNAEAAAAAEAAKNAPATGNGEAPEGTDAATEAAVANA